MTHTSKYSLSSGTTNDLWLKSRQTQGPDFNQKVIMHLMVYEINLNYK